MENFTRNKILEMSDSLKRLAAIYGRWNFGGIIKNQLSESAYTLEKIMDMRPDDNLYKIYANKIKKKLALKQIQTSDMFFTYIHPEQIAHTDETELLRYMDSLLYVRLGEPDHKQDDYSDDNGNFVMRLWAKGTDLTVVITASLMKIVESPETPLMYFVSVAKADDGSNDFRNARWGDSMSQIVEKEGRKNEWTGQILNPNVYSFSSSVANKLCDVLYFFTSDDKLVRAKYYFTNISVDGCISDYKELVSLLSEKYGVPGESVHWSDPSYARYRTEEGYEVYSGHLSYWAYWSPSFRTEIVISLRGEDGLINLAIEYSSCMHEQEAKEDRLRGL